MAKCAALVEQALPATAEEMWAQWMDVSKLALWFWPLYPDTVYEIDARQGGKFRFVSKKTGVGAYGDILEFVPNESLGLAWHWDDELSNEQEFVKVVFTNGLIRLEHSADTMDSCAMYQGVWADILYRFKNSMVEEQKVSPS